MATATNTPRATQSSDAFTLNVQYGGMNARLKAAAAATAVTPAAHAPPTTPATTTASTSTRAGVARVMWERKGTRPADTTTTRATPTSAPVTGDPPVGGRRRSGAASTSMSRSLRVLDARGPVFAPPLHRPRGHFRRGHRAREGDPPALRRAAAT